MEQCQHGALRDSERRLHRHDQADATNDTRHDCVLSSPAPLLSCTARILRSASFEVGLPWADTTH